MSYKPTYDVLPKNGTVTLSYLDPVACKINTVVYDNVNADLLAHINRLLRSQK